jgi:hypothetical protein
MVVSSSALGGDNFKEDISAFCSGMDMTGTSSSTAYAGNPTCMQVSQEKFGASNNEALIHQ